jgi:hypothetical protein
MKKLLFIVIIFSSAFTSCKKDFDELNPNDPPITAFWYTADDAIKGVNAIYSVFHRGYAGFSRAMYFHGMLKSDEGYGSGGDGGLNTLMSFAMTDANFGLTADTWDNMYVGIYRANQVIANVPNIEMDETLKKRLIAEAKFLRGFFYFHLTLYFGRPALMLEPSQIETKPRNATMEEAWAQVVKDFQEASVDLPTLTAMQIWAGQQKAPLMLSSVNRTCNKKNTRKLLRLLPGWLRGQVPLCMV